MAKRRRRSPRSKSLKRKRGNRPPRDRIVVLCEGGTEKSYLEELKREYRSAATEVRVVGHVGVPKTVVDECKREKKELERGRKSSLDTFEIWAVCDRDEHPRFKQAAREAADSDIGFAYSNPCLELWALLHFQNRTAHIARDECQRRLRQLMPTYDHRKNPSFDYETLRGREDEARKRALALHRRYEETRNPNPSTNVWRLVDVIRFGNSDKARRELAEVEPEADRFWGERFAPHRWPKKA